MNGSNPQPPPLYQTPQKPSGGGGSCVLKGCIVLVVVVMLLGVVVFSFGYYFVTRVRTTFFSHDPVAIRTFQGGDAAFAATGQKLAAFNQSLAAGQQATLLLTGDDLNALVAHDPQLSKYRDRLYLSIVNNQIVVETSFPVIDESGLRPDQRWFFNARAVVDASYTTGDFAFLLSRLESLDHRQPPALLLGTAKAYFNGIGQGFDRSFHEHPEQYGDLARLTAQVRTIILRNNQLVATSVEHPQPVAVPAASPDASPSPPPVAEPPDAR